MIVGSDLRRFAPFQSRSIRYPSGDTFSSLADASSALGIASPASRTS